MFTSCILVKLTEIVFDRLFSKIKIKIEDIELSKSVPFSYKSRTIIALRTTDICRAPRRIMKIVVLFKGTEI